MSVHPPRTAVAVISHLAVNVYPEAVLGDLEEEFQRLARRRGMGAARRWYWGQVLRSSVSFVVFGIRHPGAAHPVAAAVGGAVTVIVSTALFGELLHMALGPRPASVSILLVGTATSGCGLISAAAGGGVCAFLAGSRDRWPLVAVAVLIISSELAGVAGASTSTVAPLMAMSLLSIVSGLVLGRRIGHRLTTEQSRN